MAPAVRAAIGVSTGFLALGVLVGCGDEKAASDSSQPAGFDVSTATLTDQPFCDSIDTSTVGPLLDLPADRVHLEVTRKVGDKVEGAVEEQGLKTSDVNMCIFGTSTKEFVVTVQPSSSAHKVEKSIDDLRALKGKAASEHCTVTDAPSFGSPAATAACHGTAGSTRYVGVATGLVGDSKFFCSVILNESAKGSDLQSPLLDTCTEVLKKLAA